MQINYYIKLKRDDSISCFLTKRALKKIDGIFKVIEFIKDPERNETDIRFLLESKFKIEMSDDDYIQERLKSIKNIKEFKARYFKN